MLGFNWAVDWIERERHGEKEEMPCTNWQLDALPLALFPSVRPRTTSMRLAVYSHERTN